MHLSRDKGTWDTYNFQFENAIAIERHFQQTYPHLQNNNQLVDEKKKDFYSEKNSFKTIIYKLIKRITSKKRPEIVSSVYNIKNVFNIRKQMKIILNFILGVK